MTLFRCFSKNSKGKGEIDLWKGEFEPYLLHEVKYILWDCHAEEMTRFLLELSLDHLLHLQRERNQMGAGERSTNCQVSLSKYKPHSYGSTPTSLYLSSLILKMDIIKGM